MKARETRLPGVRIIDPTVHADDRGFFMESWHLKRYKEAGIVADFVQDNISQSSKNTLRGLHYQIKHSQGKLVRVVAGEVFDVAVDLRRSSSHFGKWIGEVLSAENKRQLWVPPGFAHGFLVTSETAIFEYKCTEFYAPEHDRVIRWDDPDIGIEWPIIGAQDPVLSAKDAAAPFLKVADTYA